MGVRQQLLRVKTWPRSSCLACRMKAVHRNLAKRLATLGLDMQQVIGQLNQQNAVESAGVMTTDLEQVQLRVGGQFDAPEDPRALPLRGPATAPPQARQLRLARSRKSPGLQRSGQRQGAL